MENVRRGRKARELVTPEDRQQAAEVSKSFRIKNKITQHELSYRLKCAAQHISGVERCVSSVSSKVIKAVLNLATA